MSIAALATVLAVEVYRAATGPASLAGAASIIATCAALAALCRCGFLQKRMHEAERKKSEEIVTALARNSELLRAVNEAAVRLLTYGAEDFESVLLKSMEMIARCTGADRIHIWKNYWKDGLLCSSEIFNWSESGGLTPGASEAMDFSYKEKLPAWEPLLRARECVNGPVRSLPREERLVFDPFNMESLLIIPMHLNDSFWGFVSFDDCREQRVFPQDQVDVLKSGGLLMVNAIARREAERIARYREERTEMMLNATPMSCVVFDGDFNPIDCSAETVKMFKAGDKRQFLEKMHLSSPEFQPDGAQSIRAMYGHLSKTFRGGRDSFEWTHRTFDGELFPVYITLVRVNLDGQEVVAGYAADLREYKKIRSDLDNRLRQQELMADIARHFMFPDDVSALITDALRRLGEFLHSHRVTVWESARDGEDPRITHVWYSSGEFRIVPTKENMSGLVRRIFPGSLPWSGEVSVVCCGDISTDERYAHLEPTKVKALMWAPLYVSGGYWGMLSVNDCERTRQWSDSDRQLVTTASSVIAVAIAREIFERERSDALAQAVSASRAKSNFLSSMSHEIRTPLNVIVGMSTIGKAAGDAEKKDYALKNIENASTHLLGVINDILDMSKIEADKLELSPVEFNFMDVLQKVTDFISFQTGEKKQVLNVNAAPDIPRTIIGDDHRLAQVITNLLSNAVKFTPEGGCITLSARLLKEERDVCVIRVDVTDSGIGVAKDRLPRLFDSYEQAERDTSRRFGGTGLGLAISKRLVEMMGGSIWVESELGKGSTFAFTMQAMRGGKSPKNAPCAEESGAEYEGRFEGRRVLLAEDVAVNREIVAVLLQPTGLDIDCAENGAEALRMFSESPGRYDMILMDVHMPEMDGCEATRGIRALGIPEARAVPIVAMTANVFKEDIEMCLEAGMNDHLGKPLDINEMMSKLRKYLKKRDS